MAALVRLGEDPFAANAPFVFISRRYNALKILGLYRNGLALWSKRIESEEKFHWPQLLEELVINLTSEQLGWLLDGYDVWAQPHRTIKFTHVSRVFPDWDFCLARYTSWALAPNKKNAALANKERRTVGVPARA